MDWHIRPEYFHDHEAIAAVTQRAFAPMPFADGDEQHLPRKLRDAGDLSLSLVAEKADKLIGQITFSPAIARDGSQGWFALGPVAVDPEYQSLGIGGQMIISGIDWLYKQDAAGCILVGNPSYYSRFGFISFPSLCPIQNLKQFFQILPMRIKQPKTIVDFHPLFH